MDFHARTAPAQVAILAPGRFPLTYADLRTRINQAVCELRRLGIEPTDRVAVVAPRGADTAMALVAVATAAVCIPVNPDFTPDELQRYFSDLKLAALVTRPDIGSASRDAARALGIPVIDLVARSDGIGDFELVGSPPGPGIAETATRGEADAFILLTSGTAARPKMVPLTHASVCLSAYNAAAVLALQPADRLLNVLPLFHAHGLISGLLTALAAGSSVILTTGFDASSFFGLLRDLQPTWYTAVPTIHRALLAAAEHDAQKAGPSSLRLIRSASASLAPATLRGLEALFGVPVIETYGMTEAASQIAANPRELRKSGSVGRPAGPEIAIMDGEGRLLPSGEHGEIVLRGPTMTRRYYNDADATAAAFRDGWFRTGDLGYLDTDGYLFIVGRIKDVINRGGQKVSPLEVEETLLSHPQVREAGAFAIPHKRLGENVAAVVVLRPGGNATPHQLRQFARKRLAAYKVPGVIEFVPEIPKGASGKIKRSALAGLLSSAPERSDNEQGSLPRSALEARLADLWAELLELDRIGIDRDVFALGADSLAVTQMLSRLRQQLGVDLSFQDIFDAPTVAALAGRLQSSAQRDVPAPLLRHMPTDGGNTPLSFQQHRMYVVSRLDPTGYNYNVVEVARFSGALDADALESSLAAICKRHDILRSTFFEAHGEPVQRPHPMIPRLERLKLRARARRNRQAALRREALILARQPFDLEREPPLRAKLLQFDKSDHVLAISIHHLATDGWSQRLFWQELATHYAAAGTGDVTPPPEPALQYRDYVTWQRTWSQTDAARQQLDYWRAQLKDVTTLPLRTDRPRPEIRSGRGARRSVSLSRELSEGIRSLSKARGVTPFMTLLAAFQCLLYRYTGHEDVAVGSLIANRNHVQLERLVGLFANTIVLRTDLSGDPTFGELLRRVRQVTLDAYRNQDLPIEEILRALKVSRGRDGNPLFQVMFILQNASIEAATFPKVATRRLDIDPKISRFDLTLELVHTDGRFSGVFEYSTDLFDASTMARMAAHFHALLRAIVANPDERICRLPILSASERRRVLAMSRGKEADFTRRGNFWGRFDRQVKRAPQALAVSAGRTRLSYRELGLRSLAIAERLAREGIGAETVVAVLAERGPNLLAAMIAIQRLGAAFLCLDPSQPARRLASALRSSGARLLLSSRGCAPVLDEIISGLTSEHRMPMIRLDSLIGRTPGKSGRTAGAPSGLAYVIYTSGSSGVPKGVLIERRGLSNHLASLISELKLSATDVIAQTAPQSFVISVWQHLAGLMVGARIHVCRTEIVQDPVLLAREIARESITVLQIVPSLLRLVLERVEEAPIGAAFSGLRLLVSTGEPLTADLCCAWFRHFPGVPLVNAYGASECSDDVALHRLDATPTTPGVPIGRPLPNTQLYILDSHLQPTPIGVVGELWVGGAGVGRGYVGDPAQTDRRFLPDQFSKEAGGRLYRTGDLARWRADGAAECLGRIDQQVKIRGYRIELKEIEHVLSDHPDVRAAIVESRGGADRELQLIAHVVARMESRPNATELREFLKARLPAHAIPAAFLFPEQVPLNAHGKVDRSALSAPAHVETMPEDTAVPARRFTEKVLSDLWIDLLRLPSIGITDNFFDLGGHSLLAGQVMARIARAFGISLPIRAIFEAPTVERLARRIDEALATPRRPASAGIPRLESNAPRLLSLAQAQMIRMERELPGLPQFNLPFALRLRGPLDVGALKQSLDGVIRRHESLHAAFGWNGNEPVLVVAPPEETGSSLAVEDIGAGASPGNKHLKNLQLKKAGLLAEQEAWTPMDLSRAPLLRARLLRLEADDHVLLLTIHHAVADGWSIGILFEEISRRYAALTTRVSEPPAPPVPAFSDVARWQRWWCTTELAARQLAYWRETLRGAAPVFDRGDIAEGAPLGSPTAHEPVDLPADLITGLNGFAARHNGTLFMSLLTGLKALLMSRMGRDDICVAIAMANRIHPDTDRVIGPFENTAIIRTRLDRDLSFTEAFDRVRRSVLEAHARQELPFDILAAQLEEDGLDPASLVQVYFTLQNPLRQPLRLRDVAVRALGDVYREGQPVLPIDQTWLSLMLKERPSGITGSCSYKSDRFEGGTMAQWMRDFTSILAGATARPSLPLGRLLERRAAWPTMKPLLFD